MNNGLRSDLVHIVSIDSQGAASRCVWLARQAAQQVGFDAVGQARFATAVSELAQNVVRYANCGTMRLRNVHRQRQRGVEAVVEDAGPGIHDIEGVMQERVSTGGGLGLGLPGTRRMMDEFQIESTPGQGTRVAIRLWLAP